MAQLGTPVGMLALVGLTLAGCPLGTPLGTYEFEVLEARATTAPMPVAPPPAQGDHVVDLTLRELGATRTSGGELGAGAVTGMHPLRTDGALTVRVTRFFAIRALGALGYGSPIGAALSPFPNRASASGGIGAVLGYWGDPAWSITLEVDGALVLLDNRERYATAIGQCYSYPVLFGGDQISCFPDRLTGAVASYQGMHIVPTPAASLDVAGFPIEWLRIGGGASVQDYVSRNIGGDVRHEAVGIARLFVELHWMDVWVGFEAQQWVVENVTFAPALAISIGGVLLEPPAPAPDEPPYPEDDPGDTDRPAPPSNFVVPSPPPSTYSLDAPVENAEPTPSVPWLEGVAP